MSNYDFKPNEVIVVPATPPITHGMLTGKMSVGVTVVHLPTGKLVTATEGHNQHINSESALQELWELVKNLPSYDKLLEESKLYPNAVLAQSIADLTRDLSTLAVQLKDVTDSRDYFKNGMAELQDYIDKIEPQHAVVKSALVAADDILSGHRKYPDLLEYGLIKSAIKTPAQCLAEIRAQAVKDALNHILSMPQTSHQSFFRNGQYMYVSNRSLDEYANQLRQPDKAGD